MNDGRQELGFPRASKPDISAVRRPVELGHGPRGALLPLSPLPRALLAQVRQWALGRPGKTAGPSLRPLLGALRPSVAMQVIAMVAMRGGEGPGGGSQFPGLFLASSALLCFDRRGVPLSSRRMQPYTFLAPS